MRFIPPRRPSKVVDPSSVEADADSVFTAIGTIPVGHGPIADIATDGDALVVTNYGDNTVTVIDADNLTLGSTVIASGEPSAVAVVDHRAYVRTAAASYDSISVIDMVAATLTATHPLAFSVTGVAVDPDGKRVFATRTRRDGADIAVINTTTDEVGTIEIAGAGIAVDAVRVSPDGHRLYVAASDAHRGYLIVVDAHATRVITTVPIGAPIRDVAVSLDGSVVGILTWHPAWDGAFHTIDTKTNRIAAAGAIGGCPIQLTLSPDGTRAYVVDRDHVNVLCTVTNELLEAFTVGAPPSCVAASADGSRLYVADYTGTVTAFSILNALTTLPRVQLKAMAMVPADEMNDLELAAS